MLAVHRQRGLVQAGERAYEDAHQCEVARRFPACSTIRMSANHRSPAANSRRSHLIADGCRRFVTVSKYLAALRQDSARRCQSGRPVIQGEPASAGSPRTHESGAEAPRQLIRPATSCMKSASRWRARGRRRRKSAPGGRADGRVTLRANDAEFQRPCGRRYVTPERMYKRTEVPARAYYVDSCRPICRNIFLYFLPLPQGRWKLVTSDFGRSRRYGSGGWTFADPGTSSRLRGRRALQRRTQELLPLT